MIIIASKKSVLIQVIGKQIKCKFPTTRALPASAKAACCLAMLVLRVFLSAKQRIGDRSLHNCVAYGPAAL
jgi:hypothetical protein